jgi:hypothetical protein
MPGSVGSLPRCCTLAVQLPQYRTAIGQLPWSWPARINQLLPSLPDHASMCQPPHVLPSHQPRCHAFLQAPRLKRPHMHGVHAVASKPSVLLTISAADLARFGPRLQQPLAVVAEARRTFLVARWARAQASRRGGWCAVCCTVLGLVD